MSGSVRFTAFVNELCAINGPHFTPLSYINKARHIIKRVDLDPSGHHGNIFDRVHNQIGSRTDRRGN